MRGYAAHGFNPRARGGRDLDKRASCAFNWFQSTRPRGARPTSLSLRLERLVSIHAPAGGATRSLAIAHLFRIVSIHAPAGGATLARASDLVFFSFNPRARGGRDKLKSAIADVLRFQSTRPRGARLVP